jgi:N-acetylglucosamine malate deacetylase 1
MSKPEFNRSVVAFMAHPDDAEIFCAGALKLLHDRGFRVTICTATGGGMGGIGSNETATVAIRQAEAERAAAILGAEYCTLGGRDGFLYDTEQMRIAAQDVIRRVEAGIVIGHLPFDYHADHRAAAGITDAAAMLATLPNVPSRYPPLHVNPLLYHSSTLGLSDPLGNPLPRPHFFVDVSTAWETKMRMIECHQSQIELMRVMHKIEDFLGAMQAQDVLWGRTAGVPCAEAYWQHLGGGFQKIPLIQTELQEFVRG